ncbi:MAG TPA: hypothetical protein VJ718_10355, partial [Candidatus Binataceae bacterium]|nr:hypothetical protein [Candidatus Binataceae bacterium]
MTGGIGCEIAHSIPGRVRFRFAWMMREDAPLDGFHEAAKELRGVTGVRINTYCGSAVINYDCRLTNVSELERGLRAIDLDALKARCDAADRSSLGAKPPAAWLSRLEPSGWSALALATGALALSFAAAALA